MLKSLFSNKKHFKAAAAVLAVLAAGLLVWFTITAEEPGRNAIATEMETGSAAFFATERDFSALARGM